MSKPCRLWRGLFDKNGYGKITVNYETWRVHRLVWWLVHGEVPPLLRHTCDNPACFELTHLLPGTQADNIADKVARDRQARGERSGNAKLTAEVVREIRDLYASGAHSYRSVAAITHVPRGTVVDIVHRRTWRHVE